MRAGIAQLLLIVAAGVVPATSVGQLRNDNVPRGRIVNDEEEIRQEVERSRFHLGPVRLIPRLEFSEVGYDSNVYGTNVGNEVADWSATVQGGLNLLLPVGRKMFVQALVLPRYTWYAEIAERRGFGGLYGGYLYGFFNRLGFRMSGSQSKSLSYLTSETEAQANEDRTSFSGKVDVGLTRSLWIFGTADYDKLRFQPIAGEPLPPESVLQFERTDTAGRAGLRYRFSSDWAVSVAVEGTRSQFVQDPDVRDNRSTAYLVGIFFDRPRFFINLSGGYRLGRPDGGSTFLPYSTPTGSGFVSYVLSSRIEVQAYGRRSIAYGSFNDSPYFIESRYGGIVFLQVHPRLSLQAFGETGMNDYQELIFVGDTQVKRRDDVTAFGGGGRVRLVGRLLVVLLYSHTEYRSNIPSESRTIARFTTNFMFERQ